MNQKVLMNQPEDVEAVRFCSGIIFLHQNVPLLQSGGGWRFDGPKIFARSVGFSDIRRFGPGSGNGGKQP